MGTPGEQQQKQKENVKRENGTKNGDGCIFLFSMQIYDRSRGMKPM